MAILDSAKVDLLYKKLFGVAKTDTATNKSPSNESIASASLNRGDKTWIESGSISAAAPAANTDIIQVYKNQYTVNCSADTTSTAVGGIFPTWKTNLTDWIPPEFGNTYFVQVFSNDRTNAANVAATGLQMFDSGIAGVGEWFFDYQSGVLNFIGGTIPSGLVSANNVYISGYRYTGLKDVNSSLVLKRGDTITGNILISNTTSSTSNTSGALVVTGGVGVTGNVFIDSLTITSNNISVNSATVDGGNF